MHSYISLPMFYRSTVFMLRAVWWRVEDHRHHRRACGDGQDPHASGLACARAKALTGAARARVMQSHKVECSPLGSMQSPKNHASGEFAPNTARLSACWAAIELRTVKRSVEIFYSHPRPGIYTVFLPGAGSAMPSSPARAADCVANDRRLTTRSML